jgi:hypothetical protein
MKNRFLPAIEATFILFAISALVGTIILWKAQASASQIFLSTSIPAFASVLLLLLSGFIQIFPEAKISFPVNVTLPLLHCALTIAMVHLVLTMPNAIQTVPRQLVVATVWENWIVLGSVLLTQVFTLSIIAATGPAAMRRR